jgi:hypothetical protein
LQKRCRSGRGGEEFFSPILHLPTRSLQIYYISILSIVYLVGPAQIGAHHGGAPRDVDGIRARGMKLGVVQDGCGGNRHQQRRGYPAGQVGDRRHIA